MRTLIVFQFSHSEEYFVNKVKIYQRIYKRNFVFIVYNLFPFTAINEIFITSDLSHAISTYFHNRILYFCIEINVSSRLEYYFQNNIKSFITIKQSTIQLLLIM
jgi:hypothetical protein